MKNWTIVTLLLFIACTATGQSAPGAIEGVVVDSKTNEPVINAAIMLYQGNVLKARAITDFDGVFSVNPAGTGYNYIEVNYNLSTGKVKKTITLIPNKIVNVRLEIGVDSNNSKKLIITIINACVADHSIIGHPYLSNNRDCAAIAPGVYQKGSLGDGPSYIDIAEARRSGTLYIIDGVQVAGVSDVPKQRKSFTHRAWMSVKKCWRILF